MENKEKLFYTPEEVAEVLNTHIFTIYRHIRSGKLYATNVGTDKRKSYRISAENLKAFINKDRHEPVSSAGATQNP